MALETKYLQEIRDNSKQLKRIADKVDIIAKMLADRKTKPSDSEKPNNCETCRFDDRYGDESICKECARHYSDNYAPIEDEPQTERSE